MTLLKIEILIYYLGYQLSWLERTPDKGEVPGSNPGWPKRNFFTKQRALGKIEIFIVYKSQANKSLRRIPWCSEAMKGVATDDMFRGTGSKF